MLSSLFRLQLYEHFGNSFISCIEQWAGLNETYCLIYCRFDEKKYTDQMYEEFGVFLPDSISTAVTKRRAEYLAGRVAARTAISSALPFNEVIQIYTGKNREPIFPEGLSGSISHCGREAVCLLGEQNNVRNIGIDIEKFLTAKTISEIGNRVYDRTELALLMRHTREISISATLIFSSKETIFKAFFPVIKKMFDFECAKLILCDRRDQKLTFDVSVRLSDGKIATTKIDCFYVISCSSVITFASHDPKNLFLADFDDPIKGARPYTLETL